MSAESFPTVRVLCEVPALTMNDAADAQALRGITVMSNPEAVAVFSGAYPDGVLASDVAGNGFRLERDQLVTSRPHEAGTLRHFARLLGACAADPQTEIARPAEATSLRVLSRRLLELANGRPDVASATLHRR